MRNTIHALLFAALLISGCAPVIVGGGAAGAIKAGTDERTVGTMVDDTSLFSKVKVAMLNTPGLQAGNIDVDVVDGVVTLTGLVDSADQIRLAEEVALTVEGVKRVTNLITVGSRTMGQALEDKVIVGEINRRLILEPNMRAFNIDVDANNGVVTLTGIASTQEMKDLAIQFARETKGVTEIIDNLKVANQ